MVDKVKAEKGTEMAKCVEEREVRKVVVLDFARGGRAS